MTSWHLIRVRVKQGSEFQPGHPRRKRDLGVVSGSRCSTGLSFYKQTPLVEPRNTARLLVHLHHRHLTAETAAQWATDALVDDFDSPALRRLAGVDSRFTTCYEIEPDVSRALEELGIARPQPDEILQRYERETAAAILDRRLSPLAGLSDLFHNVVVASDYDWRFIPWYYLDDGLDPYDLRDYTPVPKPALIPSILRYAKEVCESSPDVTPLALSFSV
ncbi:MAG TPA: hypothetical protein VGS57_18775 [Thermoanaerobaculia bacterium]|nr:hypothetical protein [Thermoanaerobaculia bacterium]